MPLERLLDTADFRSPMPKGVLSWSRTLYIDLEGDFKEIFGFKRS
jgi:hypothetical protein